MYEILNTPVNYGGLELKNRVIFAPTSLGLPQEEQLERLRRGLRRAREQELTPRQREMVFLYYDRGLKMSQIAQKLGVNRSTVSRTVKRAKQRLYRCLRYAL